MLLPLPPPLFLFCYSHSKDLLSTLPKTLKKLQALHHPPAERHLSSVKNTVSKVNGSASIIHSKLSASVFTLIAFNQISTPSNPAKTFNSGFPHRFCHGSCKFGCLRRLQCFGSNFICCLCSVSFQRYAQRWSPPVQ